MTAMRIGPWQLPARAVLAPMAGIPIGRSAFWHADSGAGLAASEMLDQRHEACGIPPSPDIGWTNTGEPEPRVVQLAGDGAHADRRGQRDSTSTGARKLLISTWDLSGKKSLRTLVRLRAAAR